MKKELNPFQFRNINLLTHLLEQDAITDEIVEFIRQSELDYFSLFDKYRLLEKNINIDEKTNILKFKKDYLTNILKTALRIYYGMHNMNYFVSLVRFDIDDFSIFNNKYGHEVGDKVLIAVANILKLNSRPTDYVIRFGGEEFDVILPGTDMDGAAVYVEKIYKKLKKTHVSYKKEKLAVTMSAGISYFSYNFKNSKTIIDQKIEKSFKNLQKEADDALYEAKYLGKNRYSIYSKNKSDEYPKIRRMYIKLK
ncbi:MAG: GGDEF domain-containing protein [Spirochaetes bacterium]|jgi:diguanylate cyclase (GGDEF)-like protein|nr:GGDEF domain-containing protein [Spirochaetota bacterium]